jgi:hypothetical protein
MFGVIDGIWLAYDRRRVKSSTLGQRLPASPSLRVPTFLALLLGSGLLAVLEDSAARSMYPSVPFWIRVAVIVFLVSIGVSELGRLVILEPDSKGSTGRD